MSWMKMHPVVKRLEGDYAEGVRLSKKEMKPIEARLLRSKTLPKYDITIKPVASGRESSPCRSPKNQRRADVPPEACPQAVFERRQHQMPACKPRAQTQESPAF